jgi:flagellar hook-basal body complex protein FliE
MLGRAVSGAVQTSQAAETQAMQAVSGQGNLTEVVQAVSRAELTLQTATAIRDRVVQAYQDIMRMPI